MTQGEANTVESSLGTLIPLRGVGKFPMSQFRRSSLFLPLMFFLHHRGCWLFHSSLGRHILFKSLLSPLLVHFFTILLLISVLVTPLLYTFIILFKPWPWMIRHRLFVCFLTLILLKFWFGVSTFRVVLVLIVGSVFGVSYSVWLG